MKKFIPMIFNSTFVRFLHRKIINRLVAPILAIGLILIPAVANAGCRIYEHRDFGGAMYPLNKDDRLMMVDLGCSGGCEHRFFSAPWNDHVSSFRVTRGCTITLWEHVNQGGAHFRTSKSYKYVGDNWNDIASEVLCECE
ncbi:MAG: hypothetical protein ACRESZ_04225 [Methylococcales bacterium]